MQSHFSRISRAYRDLRTTDTEPIRLIQEKLKGRGPLRAADIGCGAGRYDVLLLQRLPDLHLTCVDANPDMLEEARRVLHANGLNNFETIASTLEDLSFPEGSLDCIFSFNAVHHFDFEKFLQKAGAFLKEDGRVFIYTRLPGQNARTVWGRHFPRFRDKETRLFDLAEMKGWIERAEGLRLEEVKPFRYQRVSSLERLLRQARERHYSTFALYSAEEFEVAAERFASSIRRRFPDVERVEWYDENIMLLLQKSAA